MLSPEHASWSSKSWNLCNISRGKTFFSNFLFFELILYLNIRRLFPVTCSWDTFLWVQTLLWFSPCHMFTLHVPFVTATCHCYMSLQYFPPTPCLPILPSLMPLFSVLMNRTRRGLENERSRLLSLLTDLPFFIAPHTIKNTNFSFKLECFFLSIILLGPTMFVGTFHLGVCSCW